MSKKLQTLMQQVAETASERKELEVKEKALKDALLAEMHKEGKDKEKNDYGSFTIKQYKKWKYSEAVMDLSTQLKLKQADEQDQGIAECEVTESVAFSPAKVK
jgi:hypothetical protein